MLSGISPLLVRSGRLGSLSSPPFLQFEHLFLCVSCSCLLSSPRQARGLRWTPLQWDPLTLGVCAVRIEHFLDKSWRSEVQREHVAVCCSLEWHQWSWLQKQGGYKGSKQQHHPPPTVLHLRNFAALIHLGCQTARVVFSVEGSLFR